MSVAVGSTDTDEDLEVVPVPLDRATRARLARFAKAVGDEPVAVAAKLLTDLLHDDEFWNAAARGVRLN